MIISYQHLKRNMAIVKQFNSLNESLMYEIDDSNRYCFNPTMISFDRLKIIYKLISQFPIDKDFDFISFKDIEAKELCECEIRFSAWLNVQGFSLNIFDEEWNRIVEQYR